MNKNLLVFEFLKLNTRKNIAILVFFLVLITFFLIFNNNINKNSAENKINEYEFEINSITQAIKGLPETAATEKVKKDLTTDLEIKKNQVTAILNGDWKTNLDLQIQSDEKLLANINTGAAISAFSPEDLESAISLNKEFLNRNIEPMANDSGTEGLYFSKSITSIFYSLTGVIVLVFFFGNILAGEIEKGTIRFLFTQPISKMNILGTKYFTTIAASVFIILLIFLFSFVISSSIFGIGSTNYPILVRNTDDFLIINLSELLINNTVLFIMVIIFTITLLFFFSTISGSSMLATGLTIITTIVCTTAISKVEFISSVAHLIPFSYINTWNVINGEVTLNFNNNNITFMHGVIVLLVYSIVLYIITCILFKKKELV
ncbi:ABC transporter permease [Bacillus sp. RS11]|uniref:ABC transporter permease n=1 Tax=Lysinibacillus sp. RS11 TaxID=3242682 RepID=UPI0035C77956